MKRRRENPDAVIAEKAKILRYPFSGTQWRFYIPAELSEVRYGKEDTYSSWKRDGKWFAAKAFADVFDQGDRVQMGYVWVDDNFRSKKLASRLVEAIYEKPEWKGYQWIVWGHLMHDSTVHLYDDWKFLDPRTTGGKRW